MGINPTNGYVLLMCNMAWPHIVYWNGYSSSASILENSPSNVFCMCMYQECLVAAVDQTNTLHWTDPGDPSAWPDDSQLDIDTKWGHITNIVSLDDKILIFCEKGILYLNGDIMDEPYVGVLHPEIGAIRGSVAQYGSSVIFAFGRNVYTIDGSVSLLSDAIRDNLNFPQHTRLGINDEYVYVRPPLVSGQEVETFVFEKLRYGFWSRQTYPSTTGVGANNSGYSVAPGIVKYIAQPWDCFALPGRDGNLYVQPLFDQLGVVGSGDTTPDGNSVVPAQSKIETRLLDFSDRLLTKKFRRGMIYGDGQNVEVKLTMLDNHKNSTVVYPSLSSTTLPCQFTLPVSDGTLASPPTEFQEMAIEISGENLLIQRIVIDFKPVRYNLISFE